MAEKKKNQTIASTQASPPTITNQHTEEFTSLYANNIRLEPTVYDLKLIFGESDLSTGAEVINQHTAITIPWALVRLLIYWLTVNFEITEMSVGKIAIPPSQIPPPAHPVAPELSHDPNAQKAMEIVARLREEFIASLNQ